MQATNPLAAATTAWPRDMLWLSLRWLAVATSCCFMVWWLFTEPAMPNTIVTTASRNVPMGSVYPQLSRTPEHVAQTANLSPDVDLGRLRLIRVFGVTTGNRSRLAELSVDGRPAYYSEGTAIGNAFSIAEIHVDYILLKTPEGMERLQLEASTSDSVTTVTQVPTKAPYREVNAEYKPPKLRAESADQNTTAEVNPD